MICVIQDGRVVLTFSDSADVSAWPLVNDDGQESIVSNIDSPMFVSANIPDGTSVQDLVFDGSTVSVYVPTDEERAAANRASIIEQIKEIELANPITARNLRELGIAVAEIVHAVTGKYPAGPGYQKAKDLDAVIVALRSQI